MMTNEAFSFSLRNRAAARLSMPFCSTVKASLPSTICWSMGMMPTAASFTTSTRCLPRACRVMSMMLRAPAPLRFTSR